MRFSKGSHLANIMHVYKFKLHRSVNNVLKLWYFDVLKHVSLLLYTKTKIVTPLWNTLFTQMIICTNASIVFNAIKILHNLSQLSSIHTLFSSNFLVLCLKKNQQSLPTIVILCTYIQYTLVKSFRIKNLKINIMYINFP